MEQNQTIADSVSVTAKQGSAHDEEFAILLAHMRGTLVRRLEADGNQLYRTKTQMGNKELVEGVLEKAGLPTAIDLPVHLNQVYLGSLTDEVEYHTCSCCSNFLKRFGGVVTIDSEGKTHAALWDASIFPEDNFYYAFVKNIQAVVERGRVIGAHHRSEPDWGEFEKGGFIHLAVQPPPQVAYVESEKNGHQYQAELLQDYRRMVGLFQTEQFSIANLTQLTRILDSNTLKNQEKIEGVGRWLYKTATEREAAKDSRIRENLLWRAINTAARGWAHANTTMVGTVLEDLGKGASFDDLRRKFGAKVMPDVFKRPTAPPKDQAIDATEKLFDKLGLHPSLRRRVATLDDLPETAFLWRGQKVIEVPAKQENESVFKRLKAKIAGKEERKDIKIPPLAMSWNKFSVDILPTVTSMEIYVPPQTDIFSGMITAADPDAPPILAYDFAEARNTVTTYARYMGRDERDPMKLLGVDPKIWNIENSRYHTVPVLLTSPYQWGTRDIGRFRPQIYFVIEGAYDMLLEDPNTKGLMLFPDLIKAELHSTLRVIEAISNESRVEGDPKQQVAGVTIAQGGMSVARQLRVQTPQGEREFIIDRWE